MNVKLYGEGPLVLVDDDPLDFAIASRCMRRSRVEHELLHFASGDALVSYLRDVAAGTADRPALVLVDINMPRMDGHETVAAVRRLPAFRTLPIIAMLTSSMDPEDHRKAEANGVDGYFQKPLGMQGYIDFFNSLIPEDEATANAIAC